MCSGRNYGLEICGVKSSKRPRHTRGCTAKEEEGLIVAHLKYYFTADVQNSSFMKITCLNRDWKISHSVIIFDMPTL
jgi:hypothetical protein